MKQKYLFTEKLIAHDEGISPVPKYNGYKWALLNLHHFIIKKNARYREEVAPEVDADADSEWGKGGSRVLPHPSK